MDNFMFDPFCGLKIIRLKEFLFRKRTWIERLFSWPWKPWVKSEMYENPSLPEKGECYKMKDMIYMRESDAVLLERALNEPS